MVVLEIVHDLSRVSIPDFGSIVCRPSSSKLDVLGQFRRPDRAFVTNESANPVRLSDYLDWCPIH